MAAPIDRARAKRDLDRFDLFTGKGSFEPIPLDCPPITTLGRSRPDRDLEDLLDELEAELRRDLHVDEDLDM